MLIRRIPTRAVLTTLLASVLQTRAQPPASATTPLAPMAADANPAFEVATIRPSRPGAIQSQHISGRHVGLEAYPVIDMICLAYGIHQTQIANAPAWFSERYDINGASNAEGDPSTLQKQQMIQKLLADRFALQFHHEKRELSLYTITIARDGPKLAKSVADPEGVPKMGSSGNASQQTKKFLNTTMQDFALMMEFQMGKPVLDQTGLTGHYDFTLKWARDDAPPDASAPPGFFTAIQEQLGLKMEPKKDLADVLVIDHAEKPSEN